MYRKSVIVTLYIVSVVIGFIISFAPGNHEKETEHRAGRSIKEETCSFPIAVVGDLQRTSLWEYMAGRESNDNERAEIINNINEHNPGAVIVLGDMVFEGDNIDHWKYFDSLITPLKLKDIPMFPVIGNHEYLGNNRIAMHYLTNRFPVLSEGHWYTEICDSIALIFLDSNEPQYWAEQWDEQINWFKNKLRVFDNDPSIKGILVFEHHPPYTNSTVTGDEMLIQKGFVTVFDKSKKTLAFISGHAHTYERFIINSKTFIVSGGGGGPRVELRNGPGIHHDYYSGSSPRPFNYLLINKVNSGLCFDVIGVNKGSNIFFTLEKFTLPFNI
jgi:hypothetical protein